MATSKDTITYILDQLAPLPVRTRAMFGEYGLYCGDIFVALICDDTFFVKASSAAAEFAEESWLAPPYPQAKPWYGIPGDRLEDTRWLQDFVEATAAALPPPKPKRPRTKRAATS